MGREHRKPVAGPFRERAGSHLLRGTGLGRDRGRAGRTGRGRGDLVVLVAVAGAGDRPTGRDLGGREPVGRGVLGATPGKGTFLFDGGGVFLFVLMGNGPPHGPPLPSPPLPVPTSSPLPGGQLVALPARTPLLSPTNWLPSSLLMTSPSRDLPLGAPQTNWSLSSPSPDPPRPVGRPRPRPTGCGRRPSRPRPTPPANWSPSCSRGRGKQRPALPYHRQAPPRPTGCKVRLPARGPPVPRLRPTGCLPTHSQAHGPGTVPPRTNPRGRPDQLVPGHRPIQVPRHQLVDSLPSRPAANWLPPLPAPSSPTNWLPTLDLQDRPDQLAVSLLGRPSSTPPSLANWSSPPRTVPARASRPTGSHPFPLRGGLSSANWLPPPPTVPGSYWPTTEGKRPVCDQLVDVLPPSPPPSDQLVANPARGPPFPPTGPPTGRDPGTLAGPPLPKSSPAHANWSTLVLTPVAPKSFSPRPPKRGRHKGGPLVRASSGCRFRQRSQGVPPPPAP